MLPDPPRYIQVHHISLLFKEIEKQLSNNIQTSKNINNIHSECEARLKLLKLHKNLGYAVVCTLS